MLSDASGEFEVIGDHGFHFLRLAEPLLPIVAIRQAVIAQDAAVVPELGDEGCGVGHDNGV